MTNEYIAEGTAAHTVVHQQKTERRKDLVKVYGLEISSKQYGLYGTCDSAEFTRSDNGVFIPALGEKYSILPVEYKHGKIRDEAEYNIQLCAQVLCLEEMFNCNIMTGEIYYTDSHQRFKVEMDETLRKETTNVIEQVRNSIDSYSYERPNYMKRCPKCSVYDICAPKQYMTDKYISKLWNIVGKNL